jgi:hypothetical protein
MSNAAGNVSQVTWFGTDLQRITTGGNTKNITYTNLLINPKEIYAEGTVAPRSGGDSFTSVCSATTLVKIGSQSTIEQ